MTFPALNRDGAADLIACVLSVLLAILLAHWCGARNVGWAAFSAYMVMRSYFADSAMRGGLRIVGTVAGAALALLYGRFLPFSPWLLSLSLLSIGTATLYCALLSRHGYAWLFTGLTFAIVVIDGMAHTDAAMEVFAWSRLIEVTVGTAAAILVSGILLLLLRRPASAKPAPPPVVWWQPSVLRYALQAGIALALIPWVWQAFGVHALSQSGITIMAVMMAPLASLSAVPDLRHSKSLHRFVGCALGGLMASVILLSCHGALWVMLLGVALGVAAGRYVENNVAGFGYVGMQFTLALLVVLVPDSYDAVDAGPGLARLFGIMFGLALLLPVRGVFLLAHSFIARRYP